METSFPFNSVLFWLKLGRKEGINNPEQIAGAPCSYTKAQAESQDDGSSEGDSVHEDMCLTGATICLEGHQTPEGLERCISRQLCETEDPGELMAWIFLSINAAGKEAVAPGYRFLKMTNC